MKRLFGEFAFTAGVMDSGNGDDVTCDGASSGGMAECLSVCADSDPALLDYLIVQVQWNNWASKASQTRALGALSIQTQRGQLL